MNCSEPEACGGCGSQVHSSSAARSRNPRARNRSPLSAPIRITVRSGASVATHEVMTEGFNKPHSRHVSRYRLLGPVCAFTLRDGGNDNLSLGTQELLATYYESGTRLVRRQFGKGKRNQHDVTAPGNRSVPPKRTTTLRVVARARNSLAVSCGFSVERPSFWRDKKR